MKRTILALSVGACLLLSGPNLWAQASAQINGSVTDTTGAVLPGVEITVTQTETGIGRTVLSNETGAYVLVNLPLGPFGHRLRHRSTDRSPTRRARSCLASRSP